MLSDGASRVIQLQAKQYAKEGNEVTIIAEKIDKRMESEHYQIKKIGNFSKNTVLARIQRFLFCFGIIKRDRYKELKGADLVISHWFDMNFLASKAKKKYKAKYRYHHHGSLQTFEFHTIIDRIHLKVIRFLVKRSLKNVDEIHAISRTAQNEILKMTGLKSTLEYNQIDKERFNKKANPKQIIKKYDLRNKKMFFFIGSLTPIKGINYLIESFKKADLPNALLLIAGMTHSEKYTLMLKKMAQHNQNIKFIGVVPDKDVPKFYKASTAYVSGAQAEGFGLPVAEAQACGTPVIAFDAGAHSEILKKFVRLPTGEYRHGNSKEGGGNFLIRNKDTDSFAEAIRKIAKTE